jgi:catechol 2,3-dioxygenase-like lactoylglutathione lyase family enzyme
MFSHVMIGSNDIARSKKFYDAVFGAIGGKPGTEDARGRLIYVHNGGRFMVSKPIDGKSATHANGGTIGFTMANQAEADAWDLPTAVRRSRTRRAFARVLPARSIWLTCAIPTATSYARCVACPPDPDHRW